MLNGFSIAGLRQRLTKIKITQVQSYAISKVIPKDVKLLKQKGIYHHPEIQKVLCLYVYLFEIVQKTTIYPCKSNIQRSICKDNKRR